MPPPTTNSDGFVCTNVPAVCSWLYDNICDDGGPGSEYTGCPIGTDCFDCGPRDVSLANVERRLDESAESMQTTATRRRHLQQNTTPNSVYKWSDLPTALQSTGSVGPFARDQDTGMSVSGFSFSFTARDANGLPVVRDTQLEWFERTDTY